MKIKMFNEVFNYEICGVSEFDNSLSTRNNFNKRDINLIYNFLKSWDVTILKKMNNISFIKSRINDEETLINNNYSDGYNIFRDINKINTASMVNICFFWDNDNETFMKYDIIKDDDDWFMVQFWDDVEYVFYKCDQIEGLMELLNSQFDKNVNYWDEIKKI